MIQCIYIQGNKMKKRNTKWVVWFYNNTDERDDEWATVSAKNAKEAEKKAADRFLGRNNFSFAWVRPLIEARQVYGKDWPFW